MPRRALALSATLALTAAAPLPLAQATSNATFTKQANAACTAAGAKVEALPKITKSNVATELRAEARILSSMATKLGALSPPSAKRAKYKSFVAVLRQQVTVARQTATAVDAKQAAKAKSLADRLGRLGDKSDAQARALKLSACAKTYNPGGGTAA